MKKRVVEYRFQSETADWVNPKWRESRITMFGPWDEKQTGTTEKGEECDCITPSVGQTSSQNTVLSQNWDLVPTVPTGKQSGRDDSTRKADVPGDRIVTGDRQL